MQKTLLYKFLTIGGLAILLLIPLAMIDGVINERKHYRDGVIRDVAKSSTGQQTITGAILVVPYTEKVTKETSIKDGGKVRKIAKVERYSRKQYFLPEELTINADIETEERYRGIYKVPVYQANVTMAGSFSLPKSFRDKEKDPNITFQQPYLVVGIEDIRGVQRNVSLEANQETVVLMPGSNTHFISQGLHALLPMKHAYSQKLDFNVSMALQGMKQLSFLPTGKFTQVSLSSLWPHPSFIGRFLPKTRTVSDEGFTANWQTSLFSSNMQEYLAACTKNNKCQSFNNNYFGVSLHQGVDVYLQAERSVKYAVLFIGLTFVAFFLFEVLKGLPIHAVQYGLVGVALALFYFLLISLSEHIAFGLAYVIAAAACVGLLGFYVSFVLRSLSKGLVFGGTLVALYAALYVLIRSEDYALLMGSILLFGVLAFIMIITRDVNWYQIESSAKKQVNNDKADSV
jgi:inner membrane protein